MELEDVLSRMNTLIEKEKVREQEPVRSWNLITGRDKNGVCVYCLAAMAEMHRMDCPYFTKDAEWEKQIHFSEVVETFAETEELDVSYDPSRLAYKTKFAGQTRYYLRLVGEEQSREVSRETYDRLWEEAQEEKKKNPYAPVEEPKTKQNRSCFYCDNGVAHLKEQCLKS